MEIYRGYRIEETLDGFRITLNDGSDRHTHLKSRRFCRKLIDYVVDKKLPTRVSSYIVQSCIRLSTDDNYIQKLELLLEVRNNKDKQYYFNPHKKSF